LWIAEINQTKMKTQRLLVVEDEEDICEILKFNFENEGFWVDVANSAEEAIKLKLERYDLFLLDIMMGKMSGFRLAEIIRKERRITSPIIFLTAKDTENDTLTGFSLGADDYISKPFSVREVMARIKAVLHRTQTTTKMEDNVIIKNMIIDVSSKKVIVDNVPVILTRKEFDILHMLSENQGKVFSRETIMDYIWKDDIIVSERTIDVHIARLRKKLGNYGKAFVNRSGYGYCFDADCL
jgi:two-component system, OmpR family, alkaline phosphatase synthesis response regulator PhoP